MVDLRQSAESRGSAPAVDARAPFRACAIVPAFEAEQTVGAVVAGLRRELPDCPVIVVDDGSRDQTAEAARAAGADVLRHAQNGGKGRALGTGLAEARSRGLDVALAVDADGQHPAAAARAVLMASEDPRALVLGVRDLAAAGAPRANRISNRISNFFLSRFTRRVLADTQCGLRRYPVRETLALGSRAAGYAFEAEVLLRAVSRGVPIVEVPIRVLYPPAGARTTHFDSVRDPMRIIVTVLRTLHDERRARGGRP